jgi:hypothetical protein
MAEQTSNRYTIAELEEIKRVMLTQYAPEHRRMILLDSIDKTDFWKAVGAQFPAYQVKPDSNFVSYVKENLLASLYTVIKSASVNPTSERDKQVVTNVNMALDSIWASANIGDYQYKAGERASLLNVGYTQVGWSENVVGASNPLFKKNVVLKNLDPLKFMRDPFAESLETSAHCCYTEQFHETVFARSPKYKDIFQKAKARISATSSTQMPQATGTKQPTASDGYYELTIFWVYKADKVHEIHVLNMQEILLYKESIKPNTFPIAELYCNLPAPGMLVGISAPAKVLSNYIAYNMLDSISLTAEYKNQRPPKFINNQSGLNVKAFAMHGDEADRTFIVNGFPDKAIYYHQFPTPSPGVPFMRKDLMMNIELVSGVDGRYTGRDTGSIITTGGTEEMLNRVTTIDVPKIRNYETYAKRLTHLVLANLIEYSPDREYIVSIPGKTQKKTVAVPFSQVTDAAIFSYEINISSELPRTKQRLMNAANMIMEKQMQYQQEGSAVQLITEEEWLMYQDIPMKEFMMERMGMQRLQDAQEEVSQVLFEYAELVKNGMSPDEAIMAVADSLKAKRGGMMEDPGNLVAPPGGDMSGFASPPGQPVVNPGAAMPGLAPAGMSPL